MTTDSKHGEGLSSAGTSNGPPDSPLSLAWDQTFGSDWRSRLARSENGKVLATLANVYAPGISGVYNLPKWPIAVGYGIARVPQFRAVETASGSVMANAYRSSWFLAIDVPLFP